MAQLMQIKVIACILFSAVLVSCAGVENKAVPKLTEEESKAFEATKLPYTSEYLYSDALEALGRYINKYGDFAVRVQPKTIGNSAGGKELPYNITDMVITAASRASGDLLTILPYDPEYISNDFQTGGQGSRWLPGYLISGSITEFDKDIESTASDLNLDVLLGGGKGETDIGYSRGNTYKMSRVAIDLQLLNYNTHAVIPGLFVSNTINVMEINKGNDLGFSIYGSGIGVSGMINRGQGFHRAVRNLVEYSILQLYGRLYNVPYWDLIGMEYPDENILRSIRKSFSSRSDKKQVKAIQEQLAKLPVNGTISRASGVMDDKTTEAIELFVQRYAREVPSDDLAAVYIKLREVVALSRMDNVLLSQQRKTRNRASDHVRPEVSDKDEPTTPKKFIEQFGRAEAVFQQSIFKP